LNLKAIESKMKSSISKDRIMNKKSSSNQVTLLIILLIILAAVLVVPAMIGFYAQKQFNNFVQQFNQKNQTLHVEIDQYNLGWYKSQAKITISRTNGDQDLVKQYPVSIIHGPLFSYSGQFMLGFAKAQFDAIPDPNNPTQDSIYFGFDHHVYGLIHLNMPLHYSKFVSFDKGKLSFQTNPSITKFKTQTTLHNIKTGNGLPAVKTKIKHFDLHVRGQKRDKEGGDWQYATTRKSSRLHLINTKLI